MAVTQIEDSKNLGDDEEVSSDLQGYLEVEEVMGMWEVFCDITDTIQVARSPAHTCLANKSTKLINMGRPLQHARFEEVSALFLEHNTVPLLLIASNARGYLGGSRGGSLSVNSGGAAS